MKRLILTLGLLLVSAALLGTSTFAWFSMNKDVTINGMQVKATTPAYIYISSNSDMSGRSNSVAAPSTVTTVSPASTKDLINWFKGESDSANSSAIGETGYVSKASSDTLYANQTYYVQSPNNAVQNLKVNTITVSYTGTTSAVNPALRVAVKCGDTILFFAPLSTATSTNAVVKAGGSTVTDRTETLALVQKSAADTTATGTTTANYNAKDTGKNSVVIAEMTADTIYTIEVYVYFDGEDTACSSMNAVNLNQLGVTLAFQAD